MYDSIMGEDVVGDCPFSVGDITTEIPGILYARVIGVEYNYDGTFIVDYEYNMNGKILTNFSFWVVDSGCFL